MSRSRVVTSVWAGALVAAALVPGGSASAAPGSGDVTVVRGTAFPVGAGLAHVSCDSPFTAGAGAATPYVGKGPGRAPLGSRSLGFDLAGGDAAGPVVYTGSLAAAGAATLSVRAGSGTTGVAWVGWRDPAATDDTVWFGRAPLAVAAGGWRSVDTAGLTFTWTAYDAATGEPITTDAPVPAPGTVADLVAARGDGAGLVALTLGCDGAPFAVDALRYDGTTYDLEGLATGLSLEGLPDRLVAGESATVRGTLTTRPDVRVPRATALLERRTDDGAWAVVRVADVAPDGSVSAVVQPPVRTSYRWRFVDRPLAEGSTSPVQVVEVERAVTARRDDGRVLGRVTPGRAGLTVTLRRAGDDQVVGTTTSTADGDYAFGVDAVSALATGPYVVSVAAGDGNLRGDSVALPLRGSGQAAPTPTSTPTDGPTDGPTRQPDARPTRSPEAQPTREPEVDPTPQPAPAAPPTTGAAPTAEPTPPASPAAEPTATAASEPLPTPTSSQTP